MISGIMGDVASMGARVVDKGVGVFDGTALTVDGMAGLSAGTDDSVAGSDIGSDVESRNGDTS